MEIHLTDEELTHIYNKANGLDPKRHNPITTERIFSAMRAVAKRPPAILFDGFAVLQALDENARKRTSSLNVCDVLDAVVRLMRFNASSTPNDE